MLQSLKESYFMCILDIITYLLVNTYVPYDVTIINLNNV